MRRFNPASRYGRVAHRKSGGLQNRVREGSIPSSPATMDLDVHNVLRAAAQSRRGASDRIRHLSHAFAEARPLMPPVDLVAREDLVAILHGFELGAGAIARVNNLPIDQFDRRSPHSIYTTRGIPVVSSARQKYLIYLPESPRCCAHIPCANFNGDAAGNWRSSARNWTRTPGSTQVLI